MSEHEPYKVEEIANFFIEKGISENNPVNPMKLQKMLYYAYGWYYGYYGKKLFNADIKAWKYGPVINSIYHDVKEYGNYPITAPISKFLFSDMATFGLKYQTPKISDKNESDIEFLNNFWQVYSPYNQFQLSDSTHAEGTPWDSIDKQYNHNIPKNVTIPDELIEKYFKPLAQKEEESSPGTKKAN